MAPQLTIDGRELEPPAAPTRCETLALFCAPQTIRGQLGMPDAPAAASEPENARESESDAAAEERAARAQLRQLERMHRGAAAARERDRRERMRAALQETRPRYPRCKCKLRAGMTPAELQHLAGGCTDPNYVCPRLAAVRRLMDPKRAS